MALLKIGISACLLGHNVRYDGSGKRLPSIPEHPDFSIKLVPVCPEVESGLPVPREEMHLIDSPAGPRIVTIASGRDYTDRIQQWSRERLSELKEEGISGYIFKSRSPSCSLEPLDLNGIKGRRTASGIFASLFLEVFPGAPAGQETILLDLERSREFIYRAHRFHQG